MHIAQEGNDNHKTRVLACSLNNIEPYYKCHQSLTTDHIYILVSHLHWLSNTQLPTSDPRNNLQVGAQVLGALDFLQSPNGNKRSSHETFVITCQVKEATSILMPH